MRSHHFIRFITYTILIVSFFPGPSFAGDDASIIVAKDRLMSCWNITPGMVHGPVVIGVRFSLNRDGTLKGKPQVISHLKGKWQKKLAVEAVAAVERCAPFEIATEDAYRMMETMTVNFSPSEY